MKWFKLSFAILVLTVLGYQFAPKASAVSPLTASISINCELGGCFGTLAPALATGTASGGVPPYTFTWYDGNQISSPSANPNYATLTVPNNTTAVFTFNVVDSAGNRVNNVTDSCLASCDGPN